MQHAEPPVLRDLQSLLRRSLKLDNLIVDDVDARSCLPVGENYGSTILKVRASVRNAPFQQLHLIAKMLPPTQFQREMFDCNYTVPKEIYFYTKLFPAYQKFEKTFSIEPVIDVLPKFYGGRLSLNDEAHNVDDNAVILLDDLCDKGYYIGDRKQGLDLEHAKVAVRFLARFHTLGIAMKQHDPDRFQIFQRSAKSMNFNQDEVPKAIKDIIKQIETDPEMCKYAKDVKEKQVHVTPDGTSIYQLVTEPWGTIIHSDFWTNNFLFHKNSDGQVDDIKFIDFQNYLYLSPLRELAFLLAVSLNVKVEEDHCQDLIDLYYEEFIRRLKIMRCDTSPFSRAAFDKQLSSDGNIELVHCIFMLKVLSTDVDKDADPSHIKNLLLGEAGSKYHGRLKTLLKAFARKKWIDDVH